MINRLFKYRVKIIDSCFRVGKVPPHDFYPSSLQIASRKEREVNLLADAT